MFALLFTSTAWPCASLLTTDQGALATSAAQQVILEENDMGTQTKYLIEYDGDAEAFGWLIVVHGQVGDGDITEVETSEFDLYREISQPRLVSISYSTDTGAGSSFGCGNTEKSMGSTFSSNDALSVKITSEGFAGPFAYQVLSAETGDALESWLSEEGFELGETADTVAEYISDGGYSFVAISLVPDDANTPEQSRKLPALAIQSDSTVLQFPAKMALTSMAEQQRTIVYVVGDHTADVTGWGMQEINFIDGGDDPVAAFEDTLLTAGSATTPNYLRSYSGEVTGGWMTRFDTLAPRAVHTIDPQFNFIDNQYNIDTEIEVTDPDNSTFNGGWILFPFLAFGWSRRRQRNLSSQICPIRF